MVSHGCVANGKLLEKKFLKIWIQPAAGDAGGALVQLSLLSSCSETKK